MMNAIGFLPSEAPFIYFKKLWLLDDPAWIKNRKDQWRLLKTELKLTASQQKTMSQFFVYGEALPAVESGIVLNSSGIHGCNRLIMTPYSSSEEIAKLYGALSSSEQEQVLIAFFRKSRHMTCLPDHKEKVRLFIEGVFLPLVQELEVAVSALSGVLLRTARNFMYDAGQQIISPGVNNDFYVIYAVELFGEIILKLGESVADNASMQEILDRFIQILSEYKDSSCEGEQRVFVDRILSLFRSSHAAPWLKASFSRIEG